MKKDIRKADTDQLKREWDLWFEADDEDIDGVEFDYEDIHAELNRRGEGDYCAV